MHAIFEKVEKTPNVNYKFFNKLFSKAPDSILDRINIIKIPKEKRFVTAEDKMDKILILLSGRVKAIEEHLSGDIYVFSRFDAPEIFGEMEMLGGIKEFRASLVTETTCILVESPVHIYEELLKSNLDLLMERVEVVVRRSCNHERDNRFYLRLKAIDRIKVFFLHAYEQNVSEQNRADGLCELKIRRQEIADETGYSVKTVNRTIKKLTEADLIKTVGQKIIINKHQYFRLLDDLENINEAIDS